MRLFLSDFIEKFLFSDEYHFFLRQFESVRHSADQDIHLILDKRIVAFDVAMDAEIREYPLHLSARSKDGTMTKTVICCLSQRSISSLTCGI